MAAGRSGGVCKPNSSRAVQPSASARNLRPSFDRLMPPVGLDEVRAPALQSMKRRFAWREGFLRFLRVLRGSESGPGLMSFCSRGGVVAFADDNSLGALSLSFGVRKKRIKRNKGGAWGAFCAFCTGSDRLPEGCQVARRHDPSPTATQTSLGRPLVSLVSERTWRFSLSSCNAGPIWSDLRWRPKRL